MAESMLDLADDRAVRTRQRILDAAATVLSNKGFAGTRLSDVAKEADFGAAAGIYYYFSSREALIEEVMWLGTYLTRRHVVASLATLPPEATPMQRIRTAVEAHLRHILSIPDYSKAAMRNAGQLPPKLRMRQAAEEREYGAVWRALIDDAAKSGALRSGLDIRAARMFVVGALNWAPEWLSVRTGSVDAAVGTACALVVHGLSEEAPEDPTA